MEMGPGSQKASGIGNPEQEGVAISVCTWVHRAGGVFATEHPASIELWPLPDVFALWNTHGVHVAQLDGCPCGVQQGDRVRILVHIRDVQYMCADMRCGGCHYHAPRATPIHGMRPSQRRDDVASVFGSRRQLAKGIRVRIVTNRPVFKACEPT